jgi:hypothetical protein
MMQKVVWAVITGIWITAAFTLVGLVTMARIYFREAMYRNYYWRAPFDERSVAIHLGILVCGIFVSMVGWIVVRIYREERKMRAYRSRFPG